MFNDDFLIRFLAYQKERFPLLVLLFTTLAVVLSSYAIISFFTIVSNGSLKIIMAIFAVLIYLFHIRVIDECRDLGHDNQHHQRRPIQRGLISIEEIKRLDCFGLLIFIGISIWYGPYTFILGSIALLFSFVASRDFFLGEIIRKKFLIYNAINLVQTVILQTFTYTIFSSVWHTFSILWAHIIFVLSSSILIEFVRKIKIKEEESSGWDTYSWHFGFRKSLWIYGLLSIIMYLLFLIIVDALQILSGIVFVISMIFFMLLVSAIWWHSKRQSKLSENLLLFNTLVMYNGLHLIIYFTIKLLL